mmetsp:Transcript_15172/g.42775  ORF Transcript_15172/g.42775 Transcript_15172/m.42775 type:complete len:195 (+) Transcript_15172:950-1534(+)
MAPQVRSRNSHGSKPYRHTLPSHGTSSSTASAVQSNGRTMGTKPSTSSSSDRTSRTSRGSSARNMQQYVAYSRLSDDAQSVIQLCEHARMPVAKIKKGEVLFKTLVSTISITDTITRRGRWDEVNPDPFIISGTVFFVGEITEEKNTNIMFISFKPSDRVMALVKSGANARYVCIWKKRLINAPDSIPDPALLA